ncbi:MAG TPA: endonuclease/exonuclease/phosphatase family protein, partial [Tepidisphaeraceae bacterium]|nr:endonuclease/exonuclease/phosphatase family protein [Tepidisphaeraceae bacterium]
MSRGVAVVLLAWCVVTVGACAKSAAPDWAGAAVRFVHKIDGAPDGAERLMFATYNVAGGARPAGVAADVGRLAHVNAWAFQEVAVPDAAADVAIARVMPAGRWHWVVVPLNERTDDGRAREGQAIACRWPIEAVAVWPLPTGAGEKRRAAIAATLATPDGPVLLVNADLALGFFDASYGSRRQVAELARRLRAVGAPRVVVAGDF